MTAKFRIKVKGIEIDWEGDAQFLKDDLPAVVSAIVSELHDLPDAAEESSTKESKTTLTPGKFTTASMAAKTGAKSSTDLFKVALAKIQLSDGVEPASRNSILSEIKSAHRVYKPNMSKNLSQTIATLLSSGEINEPSSGHYTLSQTLLEGFEGKASQ